ncbi:response regulator [Prosthecomicrobium sp. N25]|uniref:response regulator n=1 Tax=Prosthecomicrobium sp. N25 TaxID=3129254 RepID=UPI003077D316
MAVSIVEDDPGVADSLQFLLQAMGHDVSVYPDAETFMAATRPREDDVVIVDLGLPGRSGAEAIRWLLEFDQPPRVICISGQAQKIIDESLRGLSSMQVLRKPLSGDRIASMI